MTEYEQYRRDNPNTFAALARARAAARAGNGALAQLFIDRAEAFGTVTPRQLANVQKLLDATRATRLAGLGICARCHQRGWHEIAGHAAGWCELCGYSD